MAPGFDALMSNASTANMNGTTSNNVNNPDLLYTTDSRAFQNLLSTLKITAEQETWLLDIILKRSVTVYRANATDEKKIIGKSAALLGKLDGGISAGDGVTLSPSLQACKAVQQNIAESSSDHLAVEIFLRDTTYRSLNSAAKNRESRLKERVKSVHSLLSKLESVEKAFIRALTDLKDEERKYHYLLGRKELDISEEIEKVEIDLRKCTSAMAVKQGEYDVVKSRLLDVQKSWKEEWHGFRVYTRKLELERKADIRNALLDLARASILIKQAEISRQKSLIKQLEEQDLLSELDNVHHFSPSILGQLDATLPPSLKLETIKTKLWPSGAPPLSDPITESLIHTTPYTRTKGDKSIPAQSIGTGSRRPPLDADQLASISRPGRPPALDIRQRDAATYASYKSSSTNQNKIGSDNINPASGVFSITPISLVPSLSASSSASSSGSSSSTSMASTPRTADFPVPPGSGRKSFDSPILISGGAGGGSTTSANREYGEEMFSVRRKAVPKDPMTSDKNGRSTTTPQNRNMIETPTKSSAYRSPNRSALDALLLSSRLGNSSDSKESASLLSHDNDNSNDSATPTAIKASFLLSNANTSGSMGISNTGGGGSARKASKPLPGLPPGKSLSLEEEEEKNEQDDMITEHEVINGKVDDEFAPPSLPSFSNLKLSEMRMSGMWFAQS